MKSLPQGLDEEDQEISWEASGKNEHELCRTKTGNTIRNSKALPSNLPHILGKKDLT
jgi:hypothetical protein